MRRFRIPVVAAVALLAVAGVMLAGSGGTVIVKPSEMREGETKTFTDDGRTITIRREGTTTHVKIEGAGETKNLTITRGGGGEIRIDRDGKSRSFVAGPERRRIVIDGVPIPGETLAPNMKLDPRPRARTMFVCPKDNATLMVPEGKADQTYKCPIDGTEMEKRRGHGFSFFFDDKSFESEEL